MGPRVEFRLLGPVEAWCGGRRVELGQPRLRCVAAVLLTEANRAVPAGTLVERVWGEQPPASARSAMYSCLTRIRLVLGRLDPDGEQVRLTRRGGGYLMSVDPDTVDLHRFDRLSAQARNTDDADRAAAIWATALELWRGDPYQDLAGEWLDHMRGTLHRRWLAAVLDRNDVELTRGRHAELLAELTGLCQRQPLDERLAGQFMLAAYRCGRQAEALGHYQTVRRRLVDELGVDPGAELSTLYEGILRNDAALAVSRDPVATNRGTATPPQVPQQLPAPPQMFIGRAQELAALDRVLNASTVVISAVYGMAGIGKTALAVHAAHRLADRYPDGQLFIDLHGHTPGAEPLEPADALDHLLRAVGVPGTQTPASLDERAALYRTRLAGHRMLVLLDNAADETQVAPLLPGAPGCLVLVTSRRRLAGLDHTDTLSLDMLPVADAATLFVRTAGEDRLHGQPPELVAELAELCGRLPLAIRIAAARLRSHPAWTPSHLVGRLRDQRHRLIELEAGHRSITATLDLSYQHLSLDQRRAYQLLGLHPGPDVDAYATAALLDSTVIHASRMLDQLLDANLLLEPTANRYRFHDLTRAHAAETATRDLTEPAARTALVRLLDYYRHITSLAMDSAYPFEHERRPQAPPAGAAAPDLPGPAAALAWLDTELPNLLSAAAYAADHAMPAHVLHLSAALHRHLRSRSRYRDAEILHHRALATARATGAQAAQLDTLISLGRIQCRQGKYEQATDHFREALRLAGAADLRVGELNALCSLADIDRRQGRYELAIDHFGQALRIARAIDHRQGEMDGLIGLGRMYWLRGGYELAIDHFGQALRIARTIGHRQGEMSALTGLGVVHRRQGRYGPATDHYQHLLDLARETGDRNWQFEALQGLGRLHHAVGDPDAAVAHHERALKLATELGHPADQARAHDGLAHAHRALNQDGQARTHWQLALDILTDLGVDQTDEKETTAAAIRVHLDLNRG
jgi:DNA-binding SARP family transcriptional activator/tetratricopeptide (TPR) repeat protein